MAKKSIEEKSDDARIMKLFRGRCVVNVAHRATEINEIIPRSRSKNAITMRGNRVPMCRSCHGIYHWGGVTPEKMEILVEMAKIRLETFGVDLESW
jgi:hypothetical protein